MSSREFIDYLIREYNHPFSGWDFTYLEGRRIEEPPPWSYETMAREHLARASSVVDLGTGGAERLLAFKDVFPPHVAATESYPPNLRLAQERAAPFGVVVHASSATLTEVLPFPDESFDVVLSRHSAFNAADVARILTRGGTFLTQQVDGRRTDLHAAFDAEAQWPYFTLDFVLSRIQGLPFAVEMAQEWTGEVRFTDLGAVVYYLKAVPWIVQDFAVEAHLPYLEELQRRLEVDSTLVFHQTLLLVRAKKH
jgi:SAM-dependent methyltransferase